MQNEIVIPDLGVFGPESGLRLLAACSDGRFQPGRDGVVSVTATGDGKVEFIAFGGHTLAYVRSALGFGAYYPVHPVALQRPVQAVLMDLDGTSVRSERFWIGIIEQTTASLLGHPGFTFEAADLPYVSGHSVSEHLAYAIGKYCPGRSLEAARGLYFAHTRREMQAILDGRGRADAFVPAPGLAEFLLVLKARGVKIGLVTSGLYEKAYPEIVAAFRTMDLGDPRGFYDAIITAGYPLRPGEIGTLGELSPKPHPWLYAETARVGLGIPFEARNAVVGIEDSGAGVCAVRLAGFPTIGMAGGNIIEGGTHALCTAYCATFDEVRAVLDRA
jgi:beta-phosphoglucomutase-like phosphatase (HAD superfamily)